MIGLAAMPRLLNAPAECMVELFALNLPWGLDQLNSKIRKRGAM